MKLLLALLIIFGGTFLLVFLYSLVSPAQAIELKVNEPEVIEATITSYSPVEGCDDPDCIMASGKVVYENAVACPRNIPLKTRVEILGKVYTCEDRMNIRYTNRFDIFRNDYQEARNFGVRNEIVKILKY